ncbi:hypothetical protein GWI33_012081 [Rhynchophorus ferrugineus]|uniref:Uncharacterized protein n=1 Tax=Rhynchophorus ferrugineus TaxID=354439 RepID=A0A834I8W2_RHYFE|nr:hypothetical protein GWI33_012081 [Rhynchophorus ferrugineus]
MTNERLLAGLVTIRKGIKVLSTRLKQEIDEFDRGLGVEYLILRYDLVKLQLKEFNVIHFEKNAEKLIRYSSCSANQQLKRTISHRILKDRKPKFQWYQRQNMVRYCIDWILQTLLMTAIRH